LKVPPKLVEPLVVIIVYNSFPDLDHLAPSAMTR
jgi:hypothetical protein